MAPSSQGMGTRRAVCSSARRFVSPQNGGGINRVGEILCADAGVKRDERRRGDNGWQHSARRMFANCTHSTASVTGMPPLTLQSDTRHLLHYSTPPQTERHAFYLHARKEEGRGRDRRMEMCGLGGSEVMGWSAPSPRLTLVREQQRVRIPTTVAR